MGEKMQRYLAMQKRAWQQAAQPQDQAWERVLNSAGQPSVPEQGKELRLAKGLTVSQYRPILSRAEKLCEKLRASAASSNVDDMDTFHEDVDEFLSLMTMVIDGH